MENRQLTSRLSKGEAVAALVWLPVHLLLLPLGVSALILRGQVDESMANFLIYAVGAVYMLLALHRFFRRDFDALCDRPWLMLHELLVGYGLMWLGDLLVSAVLTALDLGGNVNNDSVYELLEQNFGPIAAAAAFLAPIVEECLFRAGIFGLIRRKSRVLAYAASALLFGVYHVYQAALYDPAQWVFVLAYLPASLVLARIYERTDSIWGSVFLHMLSNGVSVLLMSSL